MVFVTTWYLEMRARPPVCKPVTPAGIELERMVSPTVPEYLALYDAVGAAWYWVDRRRMPPSELLAEIQKPEVEIHVARCGGDLVGYFELDHEASGECKLVYFGLAPAWIGRGVGGWFLERAVQQAWSDPRTRWLTVHTCSLDHPRALATYERAGFVRVDEAYADFDTSPPAA